MSKTFELLQKAKQVRAAAAPASPKPIRPAPAPVEEETPYIEVGGPDTIEGSADVLACPPPARKLYLHPPASPAEAPAAQKKVVAAPATIAFCTWNG